MTQPEVDEQTKDYLRLFDGDPIAAVYAIRDYAQQRHHAAKPKSVAVLAAVGEALISIRDVTKTYRIGRQTVTALSGVSLDIYEGEFVVITGASGSGKSTLLQVMGGLDKPTSGSIVVDGVELSSMSDRQLSRFRSKIIGFVFQFFYLQPFLRLARNLEVSGMAARTKRRDRQERVAKLAIDVGLADQLQHLPKELSGGQIQRAAIARALFNNPKVILADEPTGNLDSENGRAIIDLFEQIRSEFGTTIVVVTHDPMVARRADRVVRISDGAVV